MRIAIVDRKKCNTGKCGLECMKICPGVKMKEETIKVEEDFPIISEELCSGCGLCVKKCPFKAIQVTNLPSELGKPTFQYGSNSFRLYGFPLPKRNSVVGIIGVNGIGKTTALELLRGALKPNFGKASEADWNAVKKEFKGLEVLNYLKMIYDGGVKVSHKMQNIESLSKPVKARELLEDCDEKGALKETVKEFGLVNCMQKKMNELSGGELQLTAIACAFLKDAELYFFDEPASYLDVRQRLTLAKKIKGLSENASVMAIEHDLSVLDYLCDYVHVLYGRPGAFGVVSRLKSARNGINEYLAGYLREENVRFRNHSIRFEPSRLSEFATKKKYEYGPIEKNYPGFSMLAEKGDLGESEVMGIIGPNATGKSTFVKILAGVEKPDSGKGLGQKRISYKPQYIKSSFPGTVGELIASTDAKKEFLNEIKAKLLIDEIRDKKVSSLSGGELQALSICLTLSKEADLYLLDEPSAFLDVEQRLIVGGLVRKIVKKRNKNAFVVDHDLLFIDSVSDRLMVFEGMSGKEGLAHAPLMLRDGMNLFLKEQGITYRRDPETGRPRANKPGSVKDREQKEKGDYYYLTE
ncbi:ribosome biogenesis/translation initiation ATPase RLI [Candidatus Micrarchaeota archaeon]|nr:ribosome biogenesis/translation initiation ATPase RLI [Candidatus Micrarchaeota archaeon]